MILALDTIQSVDPTTSLIATLVLVKMPDTPSLILELATPATPLATMFLEEEKEDTERNTTPTPLQPPLTTHLHHTTATTTATTDILWDVDMDIQDILMLLHTDHISLAAHSELIYYYYYVP